MSFALSGIITVSVLFFALAAITDIRERRIRNWVTGSLATLGLSAGALEWASGVSFAAALAWPLLTALLIFAAASLLFSFNIMGGGDVKLLAAAGIFAGPTHIAALLLYTAMLGGLVAFVVLSYAYWKKRWGSNKDGESGTKNSVPYGVAISLTSIAICAQKLTVGF